MHLILVYQVLLIGLSVISLSVLILSNAFCIKDKGGEKEKIAFSGTTPEMSSQHLLWLRLSVGAFVKKKINNNKIKITQSVLLKREDGGVGGGNKEERKINVQHTCTIIITALAAVLRKCMLKRMNSIG